MRGIAAGLITGLAALAAAPNASPHAGHGPVPIDIADFKFTPASVQIYQGDSVLFTWKGPDTNHSATGADFDSDAGKSPGSVLHPPGDTYAVTFSKAGTFSFHCKVHSNMTGTVTVSATAPTPQPVAPVLTKVAVRPRTFARKTKVSFNLDWPASLRAMLRKGSKVVKEVDFNGHPGANSKTVDFGKKLKPGRFVLKLVAIDPTSGKASKTASVAVQVKR
jgi:plastocyanin